jgi:hypothetical protein
MFDAPADTWYLYVGVAAASTLALGVALSLPATAPPDATRAAATVDNVASSPHAATGHAPLDADRIDLVPTGLALRNDGGTVHASFAYGPVTPVSDGGRLRRVLDGAPPSCIFTSATAFREAAATARNRTRNWRPAGDRLVVRRVTWEGVDVTLVGA